MVQEGMWPERTRLGGLDRRHRGLDRSIAGDPAWSRRAALARSRSA